MRPMPLLNQHLFLRNLAAAMIAIAMAFAAAPGARAGDVDLQAMARRVGAQLGNLSASLNLGPAQDVQVRVAVISTDADAIEGDEPGAKMRINLRLTATQLQGGEFADYDVAVDADLRRVGRFWTCTRAMGKLGTITTMHGPVVNRKPQEPFNVTGAVQGALVRIGAAVPGWVVLQAAVVKWVSENNGLDAGSGIDEDMGKIAEKYLSADKNFGILLGPGLIKGGKATRIGAFCNQFYVVRYTEAQAKQIGLQPNNVVESYEPRQGDRRVPPDVEIGKPDFGSSPLDRGVGVHGTINVRALRHLPTADYVVRLTYSTGQQSLSNFSHFSDQLPTEEKAVEFKFGPAAPTPRSWAARWYCSWTSAKCRRMARPKPSAEPR